MVGNANMFITSMNNYLSGPKLRFDPRTFLAHYVIEAVRDYLSEVRKDLLDALIRTIFNWNKNHNLVPRWHEAENKWYGSK